MSRAARRLRAVSRAIRTRCPKTCSNRRCDWPYAKRRTCPSFRRRSGISPRAPNPEHEYARMNGKPRSYLAAAFNARPLGMPIPPNWFGLAAFALLGAFVDPGFWLIGAGLEGLYLWLLAANARFRNVVDATAYGGSSD